MSVYPPPPTPATPLGRYRVLSPLAGIRVSPLQLGAMSIGDQWEKFGLGAMNKESSLKLLDAFYEAGGNFIDTSSNYQDETSEMFIGEWMEKRGIRDQMVIATKYTTNYKRGANDIPIKVNYTGNNAKSLMVSVEASLKKLRTTYIDILYVHWWDWQTPIEEIMDNLHHLVAARKVLYLGVSNTPAWAVSYANAYAKAHGKTPFVIYQGAWNVMERSFEREIIPMARTLGLALAPWNVLASGRLRTDAEEERRMASGERGRMVFSDEWKRTENERKISAALEKVAKEVGTEHITAIAIAYVMHKTPYVFPIIGGRKIEQLMANIEALKISLSDEQIQYLESILPFDPGFPTNFTGDGTPQRTNLLYESTSQWDRWPLRQPIKPAPTA
ncbi:AAD14_3 [Sanghuangporus sanghuang]|uniref:Aldo/keto reductase n=1 Tax=Sanghuangporus baumii TaxID=108892 RepID=A0A9Q5HWJ1_SANBA|nr:Aldo/keto reductase [Sanghuangporus baumii]